MFQEKGHQGMVLTFYLTGKERSGVVAVKVQKVHHPTPLCSCSSMAFLSLLQNISNKYVYDYILVQMDRPWRGKSILQVHEGIDPSLSTKAPTSISDI
jgi:hypothetical protein